MAVLFASCTSVENYNQTISQPIPVEKLQEDINYTQHKLEKLYPNLYGYIPKAQLNAKFDSIRLVVNKPMTSKEFYFVISPLIAAVRQGSDWACAAAARPGKAPRSSQALRRRVSAGHQCCRLPRPDPPKLQSALPWQRLARE